MSKKIAILFFLSLACLAVGTLATTTTTTTTTGGNTADKPAPKHVMKIVTDPVGNFNTNTNTNSNTNTNTNTNTGGGSTGSTAGSTTSTTTGATGKVLVASVDPAIKHGPEELFSLDGQCFSTNNGNYRYQFCPFQNVTQHETTAKWNPYNGILGVFAKWITANDTYLGMHFTHGDACGKTTGRDVKVFFKCGPKHKLLHVIEPSTCHYKMLFQTPLYCNASLSVNSLFYECGINSTTSLPVEIKNSLERYQKEMEDGLVTPQGLEKHIKTELTNAKLCNPSTVRRKPTPEEIELKFRRECEAALSDRVVLTRQVTELQKQLSDALAELNTLKSANTTK